MYDKKAVKKYSQSAKGKNAVRKYQQSEKGKCTRQKIQQKYSQTEKGKFTNQKAHKKYRKTLNGHLQHIYGQIKDRCNNSRCGVYKNYGGRGIQNKFESLNEFRNYIINDLGYNDLNKIKKLEIDRIDNNGHYEKGNIRFITHKENCKNGRVWKR